MIPLLLRCLKFQFFRLPQGDTATNLVILIGKDILNKHLSNEITCVEGIYIELNLRKDN